MHPHGMMSSLKMPTMKMVRLLAVVWSCLSLFAGPALADFAEGLQAFDGGDYQAALESWQLLANAGDADAQTAVAGMYLAGAGVPRDYSLAAQWYEAAAEQGHVQAQLNLGELYANGRGLSRDPVQAFKWLGLAASTGHAWAVEMADNLARSLSPEDLAKARRLIAAWTPRR